MMQVKWIVLPAVAALLATAAADRAAGQERTGAAPMTAAGVLSHMEAANQAEINEARLAQQKASNPAVKSFAAILMQDHSRNLSRARDLAEQLDVTPAEPGTPPDAKNAMQRLEQASDAEFDRTFISRQIQVHEKEIRTIEDEFLPGADAADLRSYLQQTVKAMRQHLATAKQLQQDLGAG